MISGGRDEGSQLPAHLAVMRDMFLVVLGLIMVLIMLMVLIFVLFEVLRICILFDGKKKMDQAQGIDTANEICTVIFQISEIRKVGDRFSSNKKAVKNESETIHSSQPFWRLVLKTICLSSVSFLCSMRYQRHQKLLLGHWLLRHQSLLV